MAVKAADATVFLTTDDTQLKKGMSSAEKTVESSGGKFGSVLQGIGMSVGQGIAGIATNAVGQVMAFMGDSIGAASDLGETVSKTNVLFGESADELLAWADTAAGALGQSKQMALDAATTFATFGKSAGLGGDELVKFSTDFTGLATDLASFNNTTPEQAIEAIGAALRGEAEPLRAYGVLLDDASMRQKALELGLISTTKNALTPQQKVLAAQALIYEQTSAAQGDFARTSGGLANQQRILDANMANLKTTVGEALLPVMLAFTGAMNSLAQQALPLILPAVTAIGKGFGEFFLLLEKGWPVLGALKFGMFEAFGNNAITQMISGIISAIQDLWRAIGLIFGQGKTFEDDPGWLVSIQKFAPLVQQAMATVQQWVQAALGTAMGLFQDFSATVQTAVGGNLNFFAAWFDENMPRIQTIVETVLGAISAFWEQHGETILATVSALFNWMVGFFQLQFRTVLNIVEVFLELFTGDWEGAGETLDEILHDWQRVLETTIKGIVNSIRSRFQEVDWGGIGRSVVDGIWRGMQGAWGGLQAWFDEKLQGMRDMLPFSEPKDPDSPLRGLADSGAAIVDQIRSGIEAAGSLMAPGLGMQPAAMAAGAGAPIAITINVNGGDAGSVGGAARDGVLSALRSAGLR